MSEDLDALRRWEASGASWRVLAGPTADPPAVELALLRCDGGEVVGRLHSAEPDLLTYLAQRVASDDDVLPPPG